MNQIKKKNVLNLEFVLIILIQDIFMKIYVMLLKKMYLLYYINQIYLRGIFLYAIRHIIQLKHYPYLIEYNNYTVKLIEKLNNINMDRNTLSKYLLLINGLCEEFATQPNNFKIIMKNGEIPFYKKLLGYLYISFILVILLQIKILEIH